MRVYGRDVSRCSRHTFTSATMGFGSGTRITTRRELRELVAVLQAVATANPPARTRRTGSDAVDEPPSPGGTRGQASRLPSAAAAVDGALTTAQPVPPPPTHTHTHTHAHARKQCAMFLGWITGMHPPGHVLSVFTAGKVVLHKLQVRCVPHTVCLRVCVSWVGAP
jgi:hypothetical protein